MTLAVATLWQIARTAADTLAAATIGANTETAFATTITIKANTLIALVAYRLAFLLSITSSAAAPTIRFRIRKDNVSGTILYDTGAQTPGNNNAGQPGCQIYMLLGTAAAGASVPVHTHHVGRSNHNLEGPTTAVAQPVNLPTNADITLCFTIEYSANTAGNSCTLDGIIKEEIDGNA